MKKNTSILFLSIFALAMSVFGFMGIQPVKATTTLGEGVSAIKIADGEINFEGADISYARESTKEFVTSYGTDTFETSGDGKLKFYTSYSQKLIEETLAGKTYITGTLIARLEDVTSYDEIIVGDKKFVNVVTYNQAQNVNFLTLGKRNEDVEDKDAYWTMVSLKEIPRVNYGVKMLARPYVAVDVNGDGNYQYAYATCQDLESYAFSLASTVKEQIANGDYNDPDKSTEEKQVLTAEGREIRDTYTKFKVKVYFDPSRVDDPVWDGYGLETETIDGKTYYVTTVKYDYEDVVNAREIYKGTPFQFPSDANDYSKYSTVLGFYNRSGDVIVDGRNLTFGKASDYSSHEEYLTHVNGDMTIFEKAGPANLLDNFSDEISERASFTYSIESGVDKDGNPLMYSGKPYLKRYYAYMQQHEGAKYVGEKEDDYGVKEKGVLIIPAQLADTRASQYTRNFYFKSSIRNTEFFDSTNADYDYVAFRLMIQTTARKGEVDTVMLGVGGGVDDATFYDSTGVAGQSYINAPVNQWITVKLSRYYFEDKIGSKRMGALNEVVTGSATANFYVREGNRNLGYTQSKQPVYVKEDGSYDVERFEGEYQLCIDYMAYEKEMGLTANGQGYEMEEVVLDDGRYTGTDENGEYKYEKFARYSTVNANAGEEVTLATLFDEYTVKYTVIAPNGEIEDLGGNTFVPTQVGTYKVIASCDDYYLKDGEQTTLYKSHQQGELTLEVVGKQVSATIENANAKRGDIITLSDVISDVKYGDDVVNSNVSYLVKAPSEIEYKQDDEFVAKEEGVYSIKVQYNYNVYLAQTEALELTVGSRSLVATVKAEDDGELDLSAVAKDTTVKLGAELDDIGVVNAKYFVKSPNEVGYQEKGSVMLPVNELGVYSIKVQYNYNGVDFVDIIEFTVVIKEIEVTAQFVEFVDDECKEIDFNEITFNKTITVKVFADGEEVTQGITYSVIKRDKGSNDEVIYDYQYQVTDGTFTAVLAGDYKIYVKYADFEIQVYEITVNANSIENARVLNTFSDSTSVAASYLAGDKATMVEGTTWYDKYEGKYGVISTTGQTYNTSYSGFYLKTADYTTLKAMQNAGLAQTVYGQEKEPDDADVASFNCENWDYVSIWAYFAKPEGVEGDTLNVYYVDHSNKGYILTVNYNEWVELKLDKAILVAKLATNGKILQVFDYENDSKNYYNSNPIFYTDSSVGSVYIDSMSFEKYEGYTDFAELYFEDNIDANGETVENDENGKPTKGTPVSQNSNYQLSASRTDVVFTIRIKLNANDDDYVDAETISTKFKWEYYAYGGNVKNNGVLTNTYATAGKANYANYAAKTAPVAPAYIKPLTGANAQLWLKYTYEAEDGTKYIGYIGFFGVK